MMRRRGFSLAEVGLAVAIAVTLATVGVQGCSFVQTRAKFQELAGNAKDLHQAVDAYFSRPRGPGILSDADYPRATSSNQLTGGVYSVRPYLANPPVEGAMLQYFNPVSNLLENVLCFSVGAVFPVSSVYPTGFANTDYPTNTLAYAGKVIYFYNESAYSFSSFPIYVWDGKAAQSYYAWGIQAIDDKGYPLLTLGR